MDLLAIKECLNYMPDFVLPEYDQVFDLSIKEKI